MKILLTGEIRSGKSTVAREVLRIAGFKQVCGLLSLPVDDRDRSRGFRLLSLPGRREEIFALPRAEGGTGPGGFRVASEAFGQFGVEVLRAVEAAKDSVWILDELGVFEKGITAYVAAVRKCAAREGDSLVVVQSRALDFWTPILRAGGFGLPVEVTPVNRAALPSTLAALFTQEQDPL